MIEVPEERAEDIYYSALEIQVPEQRAAFVEHACKGDDRLRTVVQKLISAHQQAEKFLPEGGVAGDLFQVLAEHPSLPENLAGLAKGEDEFLGSTTGPYRLLQKIGEGGCGAVYMAEQEKPVRRRVAFKVIKLGMDTKSVVARFEAERQALAMMDHPNIARVLDAGATDKGRPYFVMELVRGTKITEYCDHNALDARQRLKLFIQVCHAIQHAHQKGVIHRDIKPSNILVTIIDGEPVPKVIDFGIAKAIEGRLADSTIFTPYEHFIGTPAYMSPEQAVMSGVDVDTRSDIYSLGVLLYELLTGRTPFETKELMERGIDGMRRTLQEREPQRPSVVVTTMRGQALTQLAQLRHIEPPKLISLLRGDLDWIVIRCLEKDRGRRYQTANGLAMDVQRFLSNEPVNARPPSRIYLLQKLMRRNKAAFAAGLMVALALVAGIGLSTWFWHQERQARQEQARLRVEAEDRERLAQAAYLTIQGKYEEADLLAAEVSTLKPSLESERVYRDLGWWYAKQGRWDSAAEHYKRLLQVDQKNNSWEITSDLLMAGPILIERQDLKGYEEFRQAAIAQFAGTTDPVFAERTLKISLLLPAGQPMMQSLQPLSDLAADSLQDVPDYNEPMVAWRCISLGLMAYRQGYMPSARAWAERCLSSSEINPARIATARVIRAMALWQLGERELSTQEMELSRKMITEQFANGLLPGTGGVGWWYDWLFARILLREAEVLLENPAGRSR
ncbi:MAG: serine/threonine-protein kinase [Verrucomicrobiota bacterium]